MSLNRVGISVVYSNAECNAAAGEDEIMQFASWEKQLAWKATEEETMQRDLSVVNVCIKARGVHNGQLSSLVMVVEGVSGGLYTSRGWYVFFFFSS